MSTTSTTEYEPLPDHRVKGGTLLWHTERDGRFPALYQVPDHPLVPSKDLVQNIYVFIQDTSKAAMEKKREFEKDLKVPLGPDAMMTGTGLLEIPDRSIVFAREPACTDQQDPEKDSIYAYVLNARWFMNADEIEEIEKIRDLLLGPADEITSQPPVVGDDGVVTGATAFERKHVQNGFTGVNNSRCYTLTLSHQHPPNKVAPTSSIKVVNDELSEGQAVQKRLINAMTEVATKALKRCAPAEFVKVMEEHAEWDNIPIVGYSENCFTPALQANYAPAIAYADAQTSGLTQMGVFGATAGHIDDKDSPAGLTSMVNASRIPTTYEGGRFHLLSLGVYIRLEYLSVLAFSGLNKHGGTPPIAPPGEDVQQSAVRFITVCYPPESMLNGSSNVRTNLASYGKGILSLTPEVTCNQLLEDSSCSNEATYSRDAQVFMEAAQNLQFLGRACLQIALHVVDQLPIRYRVRVDPNKFLGAFSLWEGNAARISLGPWRGAPPIDTSAPPVLPEVSSLPEDLDAEPGNPLAEYAKARQAHYLTWIDHCQKQAKFIPSMLDCDWDVYRQRILDGDFSRRAFPRGKLNKSNPSKRKKSDNENKDDGPAKKQKTDVAGANVAAAPASFLGAASGIGTLMRTIDDTRIPEESRALESEDEEDGFPSTAVVSLLDHNKSVFGFPNLDGHSANDDSSEYNSSDRRSDSEEGDSDSDDPTDSAPASSSSMVQFLEGLSPASIQNTIGNFTSVITSLKTLPSSNLAPFAHSCRSALSVIAKAPLDDQTALCASLVWPNIAKLEQFLFAQTVDMAMTRALIMLSEWSLFAWVNDIVCQSVDYSSYTRNTWVDRLVDDIKEFSIRTPGNARQLCPSRDFNPHDYLPEGEYGQPFCYQCVRARSKWDFNGKEHLNEVFRTATATIRTWLQFPSDKQRIARFTVLNILLTGNIPKSILYLDNVWDVFHRPYSVLKDEPKKNYKLPVEARFAHFQTVYLQHSIQDPDGKEQQLLTQLHDVVIQLEKLLEECNSVKKTPHAHLAAGVPVVPSGSSKPKKQKAQLTVPTASSPEDGKQIFIQYLRELFPLLSNLSPAANASKLVIKVAQEPDFLFPFRQKAPTIKCAIPILYADKKRLLTQAGIFNLLAFRGALYGSPYSTSSSLRFFESLDAWTEFHESIKVQYPTPAEELENPRPKKRTKKGKQRAPQPERPIGPAERHLCNTRAYGTANRNRSTILIPIYWHAAPLLLRFLLQAPRTVSEVYDFLTKATLFRVQNDLFPTASQSSSSSSELLDSIVSQSSLRQCFSDPKKTAFTNIGPLTALLICGDLAEAGVLAVPSAHDLGLLVASVNLGALEGLCQLGLVPRDMVADKKKLEGNTALVANAFADLHGYLSSTLTSEEKDAMGYNVLMLEHSLCKMTRVDEHLTWL